MAASDDERRDRGVLPRLRSDARAGECASFDAGIEEVAFRGGVPEGRLREHLASCTRCSESWERERVLYAVPPDIEARVLEQARRAVPRSAGVPAPDAASPPPQHRVAVRAGATPEEAVRTLGPQVLSYLRVVLNDEALAHAAFASFGERLWRDLAVRRAPLLRARAYGLAHVAALETVSAPGRSLQSARRARDIATELASAEASSARERAATPEVRFETIREALTHEERALLVLRLERAFGWDEIAEVIGVERDAPAKRFEALKKRIEKLMRSRRAVE